MDKVTHFLRQRRRPLLWAGGILCLYALLGFLFVPWFAERQLVNTLQQRLGASATIETLRFNPFTFTASIDSLNVQAADGSPLLALERLYVNLQPLRLLLLKVRLEEVTIESLQLHYTRYSETDDTVTRLAQAWMATAGPDEEVVEEDDEEDGLFPLEIGRFQYLDGSIDYRDEVPQTDFATTLGPLNIDIANISTVDIEEKGIKDFVLQLEKDAMLTWDSNFGMSPLQLVGHLALTNFSLTTPYRYMQDSLPFMLNDGRISVDLDYEFRLDEAGPHLEISNLDVQISALDAVQNSTQTAFLADGTIALENGSFLYPEMRAQAAALRIDGLNLTLQRDAEGVLNLQAMLDSFNQDSTAPAAAPAPSATTVSAQPDADTALQLTLDEFTIANTAVSFTDHTTQTPAVFNVQVQAGLQDFTLAPETELPFDARLTLESGGTLTTQGSVQLFPVLNVDTRIDLADLALQPLQAYLDEFAQVTLDSGTLGFGAQLRTNDSEVLSWQGDATLNNLQLADQQRDETLLSVDALRADNVDFSLSNQRLDISELILDAPYGRVLIDENGVTNIGEAFTPATLAAENSTAAAASTNPGDAAVAENAAEPETAATDDAAPFAISLGRMQINDASSDFTDRSLPIVFETKMMALNGEISGFSSTSSEPMAVKLEGQVDEYGLVEISGALNPMNLTAQTKVELTFTNLNMPAMTPYVIKFAGREIAEGTIDVELVYTIDDSALQASNSVTIRDMRLGARVDYPNAMDLPLDLAVALLKNREGVIDLNVPITGNVNDPQFDFGPVIRQAIFNVLGNIVTAPFRFLGSLIGGDAEEIDNIRFRPGRSDLAPPEQEKLQMLLEALTQRPQLALVIPAPLDTETDTEALQISTVDARIEAQLTQDGSGEQLPARRLAVLETLYTTAMLTPTLEELRLQFTSIPATAAQDDDENEAEPVFDELAYSASLRDRLIAAEPVTEQMLQDLAHARQQAVSAVLLAGEGVTADRLQNEDVETATLADGWISAMFDVGVIE